MTDNEVKSKENVYMNVIKKKKKSNTDRRRSIRLKVLFFKRLLSSCDLGFVHFLL